MRAPSAAGADAFPGAEGYGRQAAGGRDGQILSVTSLADSGPGSLRACVEASGPRNCVFRVGGVIALKKPLGIGSDNANLSILGQTAPEPGITITIDPLNATDIKTPLFVKNSADVLIRHIRVRLQYASNVKNADSLTIESSKRVYVDHFSGAWATDENVNTYADATDVTIANSIFGEGLQPHSKCALLGSDPRAPQNISFWRNACISNNDRNPDVNHLKGSCIEIVNNVFYNARSEWVEVFSQFAGGTPVSIVGNTFKTGPSSAGNSFAILWQDIETSSPPAIFADDNLILGFPRRSLELYGPRVEELLLKKPPCQLSVTALPSREAYREVRQSAGTFPRDEIDQRFMAELGDLRKPGKGRIRNEPRILPPSPPARSPYADQDGDGMADSSERLFGADPNHSDAWEDADGDGWSNFDNFMQWLSAERIADRYPL